MRRTTGTKVLSQVLSFALLLQTTLPAGAASTPSDSPVTIDRTIFGPKTYVRGTGKPTTWTDLVKVPNDVQAPFYIKIAQTSPVTAQLKVNGLVALAPADFKKALEIKKEIKSPRPYIILGITLEGEPGSSFTLEVIARVKPSSIPPPQVNILSPTTDTWYGPTAEAQVTFLAPAGLAQLTTLLDGSTVTLPLSSNTAQGPLTLTSEGTHQLTATVRDTVGRSTTTNVTFKADLTPPTLTVDWPAEGTVVKTSSSSFAGAVSDLLSGLSTVTCGDTPATVLYGRWACDVVLIPGLNTMTVKAQDKVGNIAQLSRTITYQPNRPPTANPGGPYTGEQGNTINFDGTASSDPDGDPLTYSWNFGGGDTATGATATHVFTSSGTYPVTLQVSDGKLTNEAMAMATITHTPPPPPPPPPDPTLPPDPATVAPPLDPTVATSMAASTEFLYTGDHPIQVGVSSGTINPAHVAVLRGKIINRDGNALPGAKVTVLAHPEFGSTKSRADGMFDMAVNGGGAVTLTYEKDGYLTVQRQVTAPWQDWAVVDDAVMIPLDPKVTTVDLAAPTMQVAQGPVVTDDSGPRQATMLFPAGTTAEKVNADGTTEPLTTMKVRATEYTVGPKGPQSMPGELPPTSGYTYAVELSADEALNAKTVEFSQPVSFYVDNFLHFPVGGIVPVGYYDRENGVWVPSENGKIVKILVPTDDLAELDLDGSDTPAPPDILMELGVTDDERRQLAKLFTPGQSLWRVPITHMTPWDCNWPYGPPKDAKDPNPGEDPSKDGREDDPCSESGGSVIDCENQTVSESVTIAGTPFTLNYISDRVPGHEASREIRIPVSGSDLPPSVKRMDVDIKVAGVTTRRSFTPELNKRDVFKWDRKDAFGRVINGTQKAEVNIRYTYDVAYREPAEFASSFGLAGGTEITGDRARGEVYLGRKSTVDLDSIDNKNNGLGGWTLNKIHAYLPSEQTLLLGDGSRRTVAGVGSVITTVAGNGLTYFGRDGGPAVAAGLRLPTEVSVDSLGNIYIADSYNNRIRKVTPDGIISTVAGVGGYESFSGDGGPAVLAGLNHPTGVSVDSLGNIYIADSWNNRIRKVSPGGTISTVAGNGVFGFSGDGGPAVSAQLHLPYGITVDSLGNIYIAEFYGHRIRKVTPEGTISTVAGNGRGWFNGDGGPAVAAQLYYPSRVTVDSLGNIYIADRSNSRIRKVTPEGTISTVAGNGEGGFSGDGGPAVTAQLYYPEGVTVDSLGNIYIADSWNHRIRKVTPDGTIITVAGNGGAGFIGDGGPALAAQLNYPLGVTVDSMGNIYIADTSNLRIRKVQPPHLGLGLSDNAVPSEDGTEFYVFDSTGRHLRTVGAKTRSIIHQFAYNPKGELISISDGDGNVTTIERDVDGKPKTIIAPHGQRTELALDSNGWLTSIIDPAGGTHKATYTESGLIQTFTDPNNNKSVMEYDDLGRLIYDRTAAGKVWTVSRGELIKGKEIGLTTGLGRTRKYKVQELPTGDRLRTNTTADGRVTESLRKTDGTTIVTTPTGLIRAVKKSPDPRLKMAAPLSSTKQTMPSGLTRETNVTRTVALNNPEDPFSLTAETTTVTLNGQPYTTVFSSATRTISGFSPTGRKSVALLDTRGRVSQSQSGTLAAASYVYDGKGRLGELTQGAGPDSRSAQFSYGTDGFLKTVTDALGRKVTFEHDLLGRVTKQTLPDGRETRTSFDARGNVTSITPPGRPAHTYTYDAGNQVSGYTAPDIGTGPTATNYAYDLEGHPTLITRPDGQTLSFAYDIGGRVSSVTTPSGIVNYTYDSGGRLSNLTESATGINLSYAYDGTLPLSTTWTGPVTGDISRTYDNNFRVVSQSVNGANTVNYAYDNDGLLTKAGDLNLTRDVENGLLSATDLGTVTDAWTYNQFGEPTNYAAKTSGADAYSVTYTRDALGRITQKNETLGATSHLYVYTYDASGRLTTVQKDGATSATYTYDPNGNRTKKVASGITTAGTYDAQDRLLTYGGNTYTYTTNGELKTKVDASGTTTYTYDVAGNLRNATLPSGTVIAYEIDGQNRRVGKKVNGTLTQGFLYNNQLQIVGELDGTGTVVSRFVYADRSNVPSFMEKGGTTYRIIADQLGSPRLVVNSADGSIAQKIDYDEFGNVLTDTNPGFIPFAFAGGLYDQNTKLVRFGARDYDPEAGRWTIKDPIQFDGQQANLFGYAFNDPINYFDPAGEEAMSDALVLATGFALADGPFPVGDLIAAGILAGVGVYEIWDWINDYEDITLSDPLEGSMCEYNEHTKNKRPSNWNKHTKPRPGRESDKKRHHPNWVPNPNKRKK